jgi:hypothetical protein
VAASVEGICESAPYRARVAIADPLAAGLRRLDARVRRWSNARWVSRGDDGRTRAEAAWELAVTLAELARRAGNLAPDEPPPRVQPHAIADQLMVLGRELQQAPDGAAYAEAGVAAVERFLRKH